MTNTKRAKKFSKVKRKKRRSKNKKESLKVQFIEIPKLLTTEIKFYPESE